MATVLRLRRTDRANEHLLLHVVQEGPNGLDVKLIGTDKERLYHGNIRDSSVESLQASNCTGNMDEWKSVLCFALLHQRPEGPLPRNLQGVEAVAVINKDTVTVALRRNIGGITQKLGAVTLEEDTQREEVEFLEWVDVAVQSSDDLRAKLDTLQAAVGSQQNQVKKLTDQLDNLVKAKKEHEDELLAKFAALLNSKKLKIRNQQRLLAGRQIDPDSAEDDVGLGTASTRSKKPERSRAGKRKASDGLQHRNVAATADDDDDETQTESGSAEAEDEERRRQETPESDEGDATGGELQSDAEENGMKTNLDDAQTIGRIATKPKSQGPESMDVDDESSTRRKLPVRRAAKAATPAPTPPPTSTAAEGDEDETDDEL